MKNKWSLILLFLIFGLAIFLRTYKFTQNPPALYWEEVALGYDAYSLLKTGRDHHGHFLPIVALESFGDYKPALYAYLIVPLIPLFGLSEYAVRMPSLLAGISMLWVLYLLAKKLGQNPLIVLAITAISPCAIHFSRAGWESHVAAALLLWGLYCGMESVGKKLKFGWALLSVVLLGLSLYTYHAARISMPLLAIGLVIYAAFVLRKNKISVKSFFSTNASVLAILGVTTFILVLPFLQNLHSPALLQRGKETSIFTNISIIEESNRLKENSDYSVASKILYHRYMLFGKEILRNYFSHFNLDFLFISGDAQPRHSTQFFGHLYHIEFLFLIFGIVSWYKQRSAEKLLLLFWLLVSIIPGSITHASPHALRMLAGFPVLALLIASGIEYLYVQYKDWLGTTKKMFLPAFILLVVVIYSVELTAFWQHYIKIYPYEYASEWQVGYKQMIIELSDKMRSHPDLPVFVSREMGRPAMYYWFYTKTDPKLVQAENESAKKDQGEFLEFQNITFLRQISEGDVTNYEGEGIFATKRNDAWEVIVSKL